jgi:DNA-binding response OmpR family regulator
MQANSSKRILIVEDEEILAAIIKSSMEERGYSVDLVLDGDKALSRIQLSHQEYDLIILDLTLPSKGGLEICQEIRAMNIHTPVVILTVNDDLKSKISLFDAGADDYLVKPFEFEELLARIRAITRRPEKVLSIDLKVSDIVLNTATQNVSRAGKNITVTLKEFRILEYFMRNPGMVISREDLVRNVYDFHYDSFSNVLDVFINRLRGKIDKGRVTKLIETVRGTGYRLRADR